MSILSDKINSYSPTVYETWEQADSPPTVIVRNNGTFSWQTTQISLNSDPVLQINGDADTDGAFAILNDWTVYGETNWSMVGFIRADFVDNYIGLLESAYNTNPPLFDMGLHITSSNRLQFRRYEGFGTSHRILESEADSIIPGKTHMFAIIDDNTTMKLYLDGQLKMSQPSVVGYQNTTIKWALFRIAGVSEESDRKTFRGAVGHWALWKGTTLTESEILDIYFTSSFTGFDGVIAANSARSYYKLEDYNSPVATNVLNESLNGSYEYINDDLGVMESIFQGESKVIYTDGGGSTHPDIPIEATFVDNTQNWSISGFFKPTVKTQGVLWDQVAYDTSLTQLDSQFRVELDNDLYVVIKMKGATTITSNIQCFVNQVCMFALVNNGSNVSLYINGIFDQSFATPAQSMNSTSGEVAFVQNTDWSDTNSVNPFYYYGYAGYFACFDKALSAQDVLDIWLEPDKVLDIAGGSSIMADLEDGIDHYQLAGAIGHVSTFNTALSPADLVNIFNTYLEWGYQSPEEPTAPVNDPKIDGTAGGDPVTFDHWGYGVRGDASQFNGFGVFAYNSHGKGLYAESNGDTAIYGYNTAEYDCAQFVSLIHTGCVGESLDGGHAFYARTGTYGPFTGSHDALLAKGVHYELGDIVTITGIAARRGISDILPFVNLAASAESKVAYGVISKVRPISEYRVNERGDTRVSLAALQASNESDYNALKNDYNHLFVNAIGEGQINVCSANGDIDAGDYICTSNILGKGQAYHGSDMRVVVAKALETVNWSQEGISVKMIACVYMSG